MSYRAHANKRKSHKTFPRRMARSRGPYICSNRSKRPSTKSSTIIKHPNSRGFEHLPLRTGPGEQMGKWEMSWDRTSWMRKFAESSEIGFRPSRRELRSSNGIPFSAVQFVIFTRKSIENRDNGNPLGDPSGAAREPGAPAARKGGGCPRRRCLGSRTD